MDRAARDAWLDDCRQRIGHRDSGLGGAAIGGVVGGVAGNRIAGRGNRTVGTIAGAAVGAAAGMAVDKAEDRGARDECEVFLDDYYARQASGYGYPGYVQQSYPGYAYGYGQQMPAYGYGAYGHGAGCCQQPMMMVPIVRVAHGEPECTVTEEVEYIEEPVRAAPPPRPRPQPVPDKRIKVTPDKRIKMK